MSATHCVYVGPLVRCRRQPSTPSRGDVDVAINSDLSRPGDLDLEHDYWLPNKSKHGIRLDEDQPPRFLPSSYSQSEISDFGYLYRSAIGKLVELYGLDNVYVIHGIVSYFM